MTEEQKNTYVTKHRSSGVTELITISAVDEAKVEHAKNYALMLETFQKTGKYIDPVSGKEFPPGQQMLEHPNRVQRRRLDKWRKTGKIQRSDQRMVAHKPNDDGGSCAW